MIFSFCFFFHLQLNFLSVYYSITLVFTFTLSLAKIKGRGPLFPSPAPKHLQSNMSVFFLTHSVFFYCLYLHWNKRVLYPLLAHNYFMIMSLSNKWKRSRFSLSSFGMIKGRSWTRWWLPFPALPLTTPVTRQSTQPVQSFSLLLCSMGWYTLSLCRAKHLAESINLINVHLAQQNWLVELLS